MSKSYSLVLNSQSQDTNFIDNSAGIARYKYYVDWNSIIPQDYFHSKFNLSFSLRSQLTGTDVDDCVTIEVNPGLLYSYGQRSQSNIIGSVCPKSYPTSTIPFQYFEAGINDNHSVQTGYPSSDSITVTIRNFDNTLATTFPQYILHLNFSLIE